MRKVLLIASILSACAAEPYVSDAMTDDLGASLPPAVATRIVSLAPSLTEMLFSLDAGSLLVGRTDWGRYPPEVAAVPSVGAGLGPNVEVVSARNPDLVLFYSSPSNVAAIAQFNTLGIPSASFRLDSLGDVARVARIVGAMAGKPSVADSLATDFAARLAARRATPIPTSRACRSVIVVWDSPPMVIGRGSFLTELLELAGARNVFDDVAGPDAEVSIETIAARSPDVIVSLGSETPGFAERAEWQVVGAVRNRKFVLVEGSQFEYPSFRSLGAADELREALAGQCDL